nr:MAG TPA: deoxyuridine 5'-triphosphate nucleotidohydrolase [Caudoviricetes sp.]
MKRYIEAVRELKMKDGEKLNINNNIEIANSHSEFGMENVNKLIAIVKGKLMNIMLDSGAKMPNRAHDTDAGLDLFSRETKVIPARGSAIFDTGVHIELRRTRSDF